MYIPAAVRSPCTLGGLAVAKIIFSLKNRRRGKRQKIKHLYLQSIESNIKIVFVTVGKNMSKSHECITVQFRHTKLIRYPRNPIDQMFIRVYISINY